MMATFLTGRASVSNNSSNLVSNIQGLEEDFVELSSTLKEVEVTGHAITDRVNEIQESLARCENNVSRLVDWNTLIENRILEYNDRQRKVNKWIISALAGSILINIILIMINFL